MHGAQLAVVVPAHNEQASIERALASILPQLEKNDRLIVVADNCSDNTARIAQRAGAEVTIRSNPNLRGKGYALDHGLRFLEQTGAPDAVIFVDADCQLHHDCIKRLARTCIQFRRPVQATYLMNAPSQLQKMASIVSFAWKVKDYVRPLGCHRLGLPCQLAGSGMAFPWDVAQMVNLASDNLVEDVKQGLDLAMMGKFPLFCPDAVVTSDVIAGKAPSYSQRARWEHGTLSIMIDYIPRLFAKFYEAPTFSLVAMALDLTVPPLAFLALLLCAQLSVAALFSVVFDVGTPIALSSTISAIFLSSIVLAWLRHGQNILPLRWLLAAPAYAIFKIPLYASFFFSRQQEWVRGEREKHG
ncbi:MAG: glycosyltransferase [Alphaproteobacteria bacterium]|nr:glycosyltransferase [Alphaproteobacteria bacterium]